MLAGIALILAIIIMLFVIFAIIGSLSADEIADAVPTCEVCGRNQAFIPYDERYFCDDCFDAFLEEQKERQRGLQEIVEKRELERETQELEAAEDLEETREKARCELFWTERNKEDSD